MGPLSRFLLGLAIATAMSVRGRKRGSLSPSGAIAAFIVGFLTFFSSVRFGLTLLTFYLTATKMTRYKSELKSRIEDGYVSSGGNRTASQVFASALPAALIAVSYLYLFGIDNVGVYSQLQSQSSLLLAYLLFVSACAGDTFASELGIVMPHPSKEPVLIIMPWRVVPRGTNGGVSIEGTIASAIGGFVIGLVFYLTGPVLGGKQWLLVLIGVVGGLLGSAFDSIIGAMFQASWLDVQTGKVLKEAPTVDELRKQKERYKHICGEDLMSGEGVNLVAALFTASISPIFMPVFLMNPS